MCEKDLILFIPYFKSSSPIRQKEIDQCISTNIKSGIFSKIILMVEGDIDVPFTHESLIIETLYFHITYSVWLHLSKRYKDSISILCNSDIYFNDEINLIKQILIKPNSFIGITRHDVIKDKVLLYADSQWSQDVWALNTNDIHTLGCLESFSIPLGKPRCDNKIAYLFAINGWGLFNPCNYIKCFHIHSSQIRTYDKYKDETIFGGCVYIHPSIELLQLSDIEYAIWPKDTKNSIKTLHLVNALKEWREGKTN
jgi:hypothetical protein